jgi:hypothetical protein
MLLGDHQIIRRTWNSAPDLNLRPVYQSVRNGSESAFPTLVDERLESGANLQYRTAASSVIEA